jgi:spermidine synthase
MISVFGALCAFSVALSAFLLFSLEPMFAKMILPLMGGAANVWIAAMMFYQLALVVGYAYAHLGSALSLRRQWAVHIGLAALAAFALPLAVPASWSPPASGNPVLALFCMMTLAVGAPFAILSATAPLVQRWFAAARPKDDAYALYAVSNAGSFAALFAYPFVVEPAFSVTRQSHYWSYGYGALILTLGVVGAYAAQRFAPRAASAATPATEGDDRINAKLILRWLALAAIPSSLMLSTTSFVSTDIASMPLLWVVPLAIYLFAFVVAFSAQSKAAGRFSAFLYPILIAPLVIVLAPTLGKSSSNEIWTLPLHLAAYACAAVLCHCELAQAKPSARRATLFFFVVACGGALGGVFNSLLAPMLFSDIYEYPIGLALACLALPTTERWLRPVPIALALLAGAATALAEGLPEPVDPNDLRYLLEYKALILVGVLLLVVVRRAPLALSTGVAAALIGAIAASASTNLVFAERNFYGVNRVRDVAQLDLRRMEHGTTVHGLLALDAAHRYTPLGYYNPLGGIAEATFAAARAPAEPKIAVVGLGAGEMVCNGAANWTYDFYEIDPGVAHIAGDAALFPFLKDCPAGHTLTLGDGRLMLRKAADASYDAVLLDAFTSDSIPTHLLTREALAEYLRKLKPQGLLILHLSNRYFNLTPVVAAAARDLGVYGAARLRVGSTLASTQLPIYGSLVVALSPTQSSLEPLLDMGWRRLKPLPDVVAWTDDWSDLLSTFAALRGGWTPAWETEPAKLAESGAPVRP